MIKLYLFINTTRKSESLHASLTLDLLGQVCTWTPHVRLQGSWR